MRFLGAAVSKETLEHLLKRPTIDRRTALITFTLVAIFTMAIMMRAFPAKYGFYLNEFDPYFDFRAASFIVDHFDKKGVEGLFDYFSWVDKGTWYPEGRNVAPSSQVGLHYAGALLYLFFRNIFGLSASLYDFLVLFPVFVGSFASVLLYLLVKKIGGSTAGLFAALLFAVSPPIIQRGSLGWYKSEPLAFFLAILAGYLFLSIYDAKTSRTGVLWKAVAAGFLLGYANTAWGGGLYFTTFFGLLFLVSPFLDVDHRKTLYTALLLVPTDLLVSSALPRPGPLMFTNPSGVLLMGGLLFVTVSFLVKKSTQPRQYVSNLAKVMFGLVLLGLTVASFGFVSGISGRYLTVLYPFQRTTNPLVESVAEHFVPTGSDYFEFFWITIFLGAFGAITVLRKRSIHSAFVLLLALTGVYIASSFSRLLVFASLAFLILGAVGFVELSSALLRASPTLLGKKQRIYQARSGPKLTYGIFMVALLSIPALYPPDTNWLRIADSPVSIANAGAAFRAEIPDWREALSWIRENTPTHQRNGKPTVVMSWWDYGYWIAEMGNRTTLADNATINQTRIAQIGRAFMSSESEAIKIIDALQADYVVVFSAAVRFETPGQAPLYFLCLPPCSPGSLGGDESKKQWFIRIGGLSISEFLFEDEFTPRLHFWDNTLLGKMFPYVPIGYLDLTRLPQANIVQDFRPGETIGTYTFAIKYPKDGPGPLRLVFASSSLEKPLPIGGGFGLIAAVLVYEVVR